MKFPSFDPLSNMFQTQGPQAKHVPQSIDFETKQRRYFFDFTNNCQLSLEVQSVLVYFL